jgi:hypothetical protein
MQSSINTHIAARYVRTPLQSNRAKVRLQSSIALHLQPRQGR